MAKYDLAEIESVPVLRVSGDLDRAEDERFQQILDAASLRGPGKVIVDFTGLTGIYSGGLRVLGLVQRALAKNGGALVLAGLHGEALEAFEIGGFSGMFAQTATVHEALCAVPSSLTRYCASSLTVFSAPLLWPKDA